MNTKHLRFLDAVPAEKLSKHPKAILPIDEHDQELLRESIIENGIRQPLIVVAGKNKDEYLIIDGCSRFQKGKETGLTSFRCELVECEDVEKFVLSLLLAHRKCATSQRVLAYVEANWVAICEQEENGRLRKLQNLKKGQCFSEGARAPTETDFTPEEVAKRLRCDPKDVREAIELVGSLETGTYPQNPESACPPKLMKEETKAIVEEHRKLILEGSAGLRRWRSAVAGKDQTKGKERKDPDYVRLMCNASVTIGNGFKAWPKIDWAKETRFNQDGVTMHIRLMFAEMPESVRHAMRAVILEKWPTSEKKLLLAELKKSTK